MCRSKNEREGGRRCPHETNPIKVAERNARRREAYRASKQSKLSTTSVNATDELGAFQSLDAERRLALTETEVHAASAEELYILTKEQRRGLSQFTGDFFEEINGALFGKPTLRTDESVRFSAYDNPSTVTGYKRVISAVDEAFMVSPLRERVVYRGKTSFESVGRQSTASYVKKNYAVGSEVVFDGYQSASVSPVIASNYAHSGGIVFEMKSKSGINVSDESEYAEEMEVLLPRNSRWRVARVGVTDYKCSTVDGDAKHYLKVTVVQMVEIADDGEELTERVAPPALTKSQMGTYM